MRTNFERRTKALETINQTDVGTDEAAQIAAFLDRLTTEELRQALAIAERTHDYELPLTEEERAFWDRIVAKYQTD